ncbi:MAG: hypothetical protein JSS34_07940 [Proteobacteria bacterium]|nr:hypothetical protein [Pseudomonadota bacterium]
MLKRILNLGMLTYLIFQINFILTNSVSLAALEQNIAISSPSDSFKPEDKNSVLKLAETYTQFQHDFGQDVPKDFNAISETLFLPIFKKIANGEELVSDRSKLLNQLKGVRDFAGKWTIESKEIIPSKDNTKCTLHYLLHSEKAGDFEVIAILRASKGKIGQIEEVYYKKK